MLSNIKILVLALAALLALSATIVPFASAQSQGTLTADGPVTLQVGETEGPLKLTGTQTGAGGSNALTTLGGKMECATATYTGYKSNETPHTLIPSGATQVTVIPSYGKCTVFGKPATVDMNGCDYVFDIEKTSGTHKFAVKTTIICPTGKDIQVTMFDNEAKHIEGNSFCTLTITENAAGYAGLTATDTTNQHIDISGTVKELTIHEKSNSALCAEATDTKSELHLDVTIQGRTRSGATQNIGISDEGKLAWEEPTPGVNAWTMFGFKAECHGVTYTGHEYDETPHGFISSGSTAITLTPNYGQAGHSCVLKVLNWPTTIDMNGCDYVLHIGETAGMEDTYHITTDVVCPAGKEIAVTMWTNTTDETSKPNEPICVRHIPPQTGLAGAYVADTGNGYIDITGTFEGTKVVQTQSATHSIFCSAAETTAVKFDIDVQVSGFNTAGSAAPISLTE